MSRSLLAYSLGVLTLLVSSGAHAQSAEKAKVPFAFTAGNVTLPAGDYVIRQKSENNYVSFIDAGTGKVVFAFSPDRESLPLEATPRLIFRRYGDQHFLEAIWTGGGGISRQFSLTGEEKSLQGHTVAGNSTKPDSLIVAMK